MAPTPKLGWRVPGLSDPENVPRDIANLGIDVESTVAPLLLDTTYTMVPLVIGAGYVKFVRVGKQVEVVVNVSGQNIPTSSGSSVLIVAVGGLPEAVRPLDARYAACNLGGQKAGLGVLNPDGSLGVFNDIGSTATVFRCSFSYIVGVTNPVSSP